MKSSLSIEHPIVTTIRLIKKNKIGSNIGSTTDSRVWVQLLVFQLNRSFLDWQIVIIHFEVIIVIIHIEDTEQQLLMSLGLHFSMARLQM